MICCGIDPGLDGCIALLNGDDLIIADMPTIEPKKKRIIDEVELARLIGVNAHHIKHAFLEDVRTRPGEGAVGAFSFGMGIGIIRGILRAHFVPMTLVAPAKWKRAMGIPSGAGKDASRALAKELFQRQAGLFARVKDHGRAEAALVALYGQRAIHGNDQAEASHA